MQSGRMSSAGSACRAPLASLLLLAVLVWPLGACSLFNKDDALPPDEPADKLYNEGVFLLDKRLDFKEAAKKFSEVERQHPYSEWARKSLLMTAYANYEGREYDEAISAARRYVALHPGSADAAYAQFLIGSAYFDRIPDITRDQAQTEKAIAALDEVARKYPDSEYAQNAKRKIEVARDQIAGKEMDTGRYYLRRKEFTGAINRFKIVVTQYQTTRHVEEALARLAESYLALGVVSEAQTAAAVLGHNFPDSRWYADAYKLVKSRGLEPLEDKGSWMSRAFGSLKSPFGGSTKNAAPAPTSAPVPKTTPGTQTPTVSAPPPAAPVPPPPGPTSSNNTGTRG
jgi:outer membrane protein assembly factor BamD